MFFQHGRLTTHPKQKNLVYSSEKKADKLLGSGSKRWNWSFSIKLGVANLTISESPKEENIRYQKMIKAGKFLKKLNNLCYEDNPRSESYLLVRLVASAGTMWPWSGHKEGMKNTAWWVGEGKDITVLAYGSLKNLLPRNDPDSDRELKSDKSSWYPSNIGTHYALIDSIKVEEDYAEAPAGLKVRALLEECFNGGLLSRDAPPLEGPGIYEMLLRVDGVDKDAHRSGAVSKKPIVYGSPIWVARALTPAPGVYKLHQKHPNPVGIRIQDMTYEMTGYARGEGLKGNLTGSEIAGSGLDAYGVWDGKSWIKTYWGQGIYRMAIDNSADVPETPQGSPSLTDAVSLGIPLNLRKKLFKRWEWDTPLSPSHGSIQVIIG